MQHSRIACRILLVQAMVFVTSVALTAVLPSLAAWYARGLGHAAAAVMLDDAEEEIEPDRRLDDIGAKLDRLIQDRPQA